MKALNIVLSCILLHMATGQIYLLCDDFEFTTEDSCSCYNPHQPFISCPSAGLTSIPNITRAHTLQLNSNNITRLRAGKLSHLTGLTKLEIINNQISRVSVFAFNGVELSLEQLDLSNNRLGAIPAVFGMANNSIKQQMHGSRVLTKLDVLKLSHNYIYSIKNDAFGGVPSLCELHLEGNPVNRIAPDSWMGPRGLRHLTLTVSNMDISSIPTDNLHLLISLHLLGAKPMRLDFVSDWFKAFPRLLHLRLEYMGLEDDHLYKGSFPSGWKNQLLSISLRGNKLTKIPYNLISQLSLRELDFSGNMIRKISYFSNYHNHDNVLMNLTKVNLGNNLISTIDAHFLLDLHQARVVDLTNNYLRNIIWRMKDIDENLHPEAVLLLGGNIWKCTCHAKWLREMIEKQMSGRNGHLSRDDIYSDLRCGPEPAVHSGELVVDVPLRAFCVLLSSP